MQSPILDAASELKHLMVARVTGASDISSSAYRSARDAIVGDPAAVKLAPECVRVCRSPDEVWTYTKGRFGLDTYQSRREFFQREFEPMLTALERFASAPLDDLVSNDAEALSAASVLAAWRKAIERRSTDPEGAITAARTLLESVCKTILDDMRTSYGPGDDLPKLYRAVSKALKLAPSQYTDDQLRRILGGVTTVVEGLGSLRNRDGDAHGRGRKSYKPSARHAGLAVNLAGSVAVFLMQTWEDRQT